MSTNEHSTTPLAGGQGTAAPSITRKYAFDPSKTILLDVEVFPGQPTRWCCGFQSADGRYTCVDGDKTQLAEILDKIHRAGRTLVSYNGDHYDLPLLRAVLAGADVFRVSQALVTYDGRGLPPELRDRAASWPRIEVDHIDLAARTQKGRYPKRLKEVAANLHTRHLAELPFPPDKVLTDSEWAQILPYK